MCNVRTFVTHKYEIFFVHIYNTYENVTWPNLYFHFSDFRIWRSAKPRPMINVILQFLELDLVNINVSAKFYQNIPNG